MHVAVVEERPRVPEGHRERLAVAHARGVVVEAAARARGERVVVGVHAVRPLPDVTPLDGLAHPDGDPGRLEVVVDDVATVRVDCAAAGAAAIPARRPPPTTARLSTVVLTSPIRTRAAVVVSEPDMGRRLGLRVP